MRKDNDESDGIMSHGRVDIPASCLRKSSFPYSVIVIVEEVVVKGQCELSERGEEYYN